MYTFTKNILIIIIILYFISGCNHQNIMIDKFEYERLIEAEARVMASEAEANELTEKIVLLSEELKEAKVKAQEVKIEMVELEEENKRLREMLVLEENEMAKMRDYGFSNPVIYSRNTVVQNPKMNQVTFEIHEKLVGRYIAESDPEMYFEIMCDGSAEISVNAFSGYSRHPSMLIQLTAYYSDNEIIICFNLIGGRWHFPGGGLSICFEGESDYSYFESSFFGKGSAIRFIKQDQN